MTLTDRVKRYLTQGMGMLEVPNKSKKYQQFVHGDRTYFVGKAGAVRAGRLASDSISVTDSVHAYMKLWERRNGL